jgi:MFS family permease
MAIPSQPSGKAPAPGTWDTAYEFKATLLLFLGFGLVGLDRWILPPLFAAQMGEDLGLSPSDLGNLVGALGIAWGVSAFVLGNVSDRLGRRKVLAPAVIFFSLMSALTGLVQTLVALIFIRVLMGVAEGAVAATGVATSVEASHPKRRGMNNGIFQCGFALFGLALAPVLATQLLQYMRWQYVFMVVALPGIIVAAFMWKIIHDKMEGAVVHASHAAGKRPSLAEMFHHKNVLLAMVNLLCAMAGVFVMSAMMPNYLTGDASYLRLSVQQMGFITSAIGVGGVLGQFGMPALSDVLGRKPVVMGCFLVSAVFLYMFTRLDGSSPAMLFALLFVASLANLGALSVIAGPIAAEAAPPGLIAAVAGLVIGAGEIFGGGIAPVIAGNIAESYGIQYTMYFAMGGQALGVLCSLFLHETAPRKLGDITPHAAVAR